MIEYFVKYAIYFNLILIAGVFLLISRAYPVLSYLGRWNRGGESTTEENQTKKHRVSILVFGAVSFAIGLGISFFLSGIHVWILFGQPATEQEVYSELGDLGASFMFGIFITVFPLIAEAIGLLVYGIGYLYKRRQNDQSGFRKYWLFYPIISIALVVMLYLASNFL